MDPALHTRCNALAMTHLRLTHPDLDFWIDVRLREVDGRWLAVADLADEAEIGLGETAEEALRGALESLGPLSDDLVAMKRPSGLRHGDP
jgi:hypothetical protein